MMTAKPTKKINLKYICFLGLISAIALVIIETKFLNVPIIPAVGFLQYDPADIVITLGGIVCGPMAVIWTSLVTAGVEMLTVSGTGPIGFAMNFISTVSFALPVCLFYKHKNKFSWLLFSLIISVFFMTSIMCFANCVVAPYWMGVDRIVVYNLLWSGFVPFNLLKGGINAVGVLLLYKPVSLTRRTVSHKA
ncbi:MAG: ECF transporter S component [Ruminococcus sp.]|jgi:riboflavin transporter FmnP|nr:ECF transporter S component [Ruminococcus sp.]